MPFVDLCYECLDRAKLSHVYMTRMGRTADCAICRKKKVLTWKYEEERLRFEDGEKERLPKE